MAGTLEGGLKAKETNYQKHGSDFYRRIGAIGGRNGNTGGFASDKVGKDGGHKGKRGPAKRKDEDDL